MELLPLRSSDFADVMLLDHHLFSDQRGDFGRLFCRESLIQCGLSPDIAQINFTRTSLRGTIRGLHFQKEPFGERKIISCLRGAVFDVLVDVRPQSATRWQWRAFELNAASGFSLVVPAGFAHGFQALTDDVEMLYLHDKPYNAEAQTGLRFNDPRLAIQWPLAITMVSEKDAQFDLIYDDKEIG